jgi:hypothetical protein
MPLRCTIFLALTLPAIGCLPSPDREATSVSSDAEQIAPEPSVPASRPEDRQPIPITFEDLDLPMEPDTLFHDWMLTQRVRDLDGRRVRLTGYICGGSVFTQRNIKQFILLREAECPYGPGGQAHHVIAVEIDSDPGISFTSRPVTLEGVLTVRPFTGVDGNTWSVYHLEGRMTKVE